MMTKTRALAILSLATILAATLPSPNAFAYPRPARVEWVTVAAVDPEPDSYSFEPRISDNGRYIAFWSQSTNLVLDDTNAQSDVFVRDLVTGVTHRASTASDGGQADFNSGGQSINPDGRYVAFSSRATNLISDDTNGTWDIFVKDLDTGATELASVTTDGNQANGLSAGPSIGGTGEWVVAFESDATNLVPEDDNGLRDVFVHDLATGTTTRVSVPPGGGESDGRSTLASISGDGRHVAFQSDATNLVPGDTNGQRDAFVADLETGEIRRVSVSTDGEQANDFTGAPVLNHDGSVVAFTTAATNLVPGDGNARQGSLDAFVHDLTTGVTERVSVSSDGTEANGDANDISGDGRYVVFRSGATNLVPNDTNNAPDIFLHDRQTGVTERVSLNHDNSQASGGLFGSSRAVVNADGSVVAFAADHPNIVPGDTGLGFDSDIFARHRGPALGISDIRVQKTGDAAVVEGSATFSGIIAASGTDPTNDGDERLGAEISSAAVILRPEAEDFQVRLGVTRLPGMRGATVPPPSPQRAIPGIAGVPGVIYGLEFAIGGVAHEVRAMRAGVTATPPGAPLFALYRCEAVCIEVARLAGGYGTTGDEIRVSVPLSSLGLTRGGQLRDVRAFAGLGEAGVGVVHMVDDLALADTNIPAPIVELGTASDGAQESDVAFDIEADLADGAFFGSLDISALSSGNHEVWARACLGNTCRSAAVPVALGEVVEQQDTDLELTVQSRGQDMTLGARLTVLGAPSEGIEGRTIDFYSDGELIGSELTNGDGVASVSVPPAHRGNNRTYEAVFAGDHLYRASSDERPGEGAGRHIAI